MMVGGAAASDLLRENAGCDFYGKTAVDGVDFAKKLVGLELMIRHGSRMLLAVACC